MSETLLAAMMGVIATVWSIGFVAYNFIYNYFERRYLDEAFRMANGEILDDGHVLHSSHVAHLIRQRPLPEQTPE